MANSVTMQTMHDGHRNLVVEIKIAGDGSGEESGTLVIDVSSYAAPVPSEVRILTVTANLGSFDASLYWDATTDVMAAAISGGGSSTSDYRPIGGLKNNAGTGKTGDILLSTLGLATGERGTILLEMRKVY